MIPAKRDAAVSRFEFSSDFSGVQIRQNEQDADTHALTDRISECESAAYARGHSDGAAAEKAGIESQKLAVIAALSDQLESLTGTLKAAHQDAQSTTAHLAFSFARKLAGRLVIANPVTPVKEAFESLLTDLIGRPDVTIRIHPDIAKALTGELQFVLRERLKGCALDVIEDGAIAPGDCRIEWATGGLIRDQAMLETRLEDLIQRSFPPCQSEKTNDHA